MHGTFENEVYCELLEEGPLSLLFFPIYSPNSAKSQGRDCTHELAKGTKWDSGGEERVLEQWRAAAAKQNN